MKPVTDPELLALLNGTAPEPEPDVAIDFDLLEKRIAEHKQTLIEEIRGIQKKAIHEVLQPECPAATTQWADLSPAQVTNASCKPVFPAHIRVGELFSEDFPESRTEGLGLPCFLPLAKRKGLIFSSDQSGESRSEELLQTIALRVALNLPPGSVQIHMVDLKSKGRAFPVIGGLDQKIAPAAPSTTEQVTVLLKTMEERVSELTRRCLTRCEWLCDFNKENLDEPEPYHLICISGYPQSLEKASCEAVSRLLQHECAARAGIYFLFSMEGGKPTAEEFKDIPFLFTAEHGAEIVDSEIDTSSSGEFSALVLVPDELPANAADYVDALNAVAKSKPKAKKVSIAVDESQIWTTSAASGVAIPIGKAGREEVQFRLGNDSVVHHALVGGATGTGKTILLHNIILNAAELYSPEDLQMILMDFKEGTEFACYEGLPHMRVLSIASELHFGHSVFEWLVAERMRRANLFKKAGVANLVDYSKKTGQKLPRFLVIMDEFQRLLAHPQIGSQVSMLLDDIVRTGRSFGINLILSTQSLANVQMESSTLTSLGLRVCLRLSESETNKFLNHDNSVPAGFNRPGQALYNDTEGRKEGNTEFQVAFVEVSEIPARCQTLRQREVERLGRQVVEEARVFHGEMPVNPHGRIPTVADDKLQAFIGEPLKIQADPVAIEFEQQDGANLLAVGQGMEILNNLVHNLAIQLLQSPLKPEILVLDALPLAKERWAEFVEKGVRFLTTPAQVNESLDQLTEELENRKLEERSEPYTPKMLFLIEAQLNRAFPPGNGMDSSPASQKVNTLLEQGPRYGIHTVLVSSRLARTDKVLGQFGSPLNLQHFATRIVYRTDEAEKLLGYDAPTKNIGEYSGVLADENTGEMTPFQTYDSIPN
jgi:S-DNA-T family DNA segregation ATPase FtsK/SpoIIIE